jgi:hypothetical protein
MRIPVPTNRLVAFTLAGALLTMVVAAGLAVPGLGPGPAESPSDTSRTDLAPDAPQPNENFTPDVQTGSEYEDEEYEEEEYEEYEDDDDEYEEEYEGHEDREYEDDDDEYEED